MPNTDLDARNTNYTFSICQYSISRGVLLPNIVTITFTIPEESNVKTYIIEEKSNTVDIREKKNKLNKWRFYNNLEEEEKQRLIEKRTRNWRRVIDDELIVGYDKEEDEE